MDPKECLRLVDQMTSDGRYIDALILLGQYWHWRARDGAEPIEVAGTLDRGDDFARKCKTRLDTAMGTKPVEFTCNVDEAPMPWSQGGFTSLESARLWAIGEARRIEEADEGRGDDFGQIYCEDSLGNSWNLVEENGLYSWETADVIKEQYPIHELPRRAS